MALTLKQLQGRKVLAEIVRRNYYKSILTDTNLTCFKQLERGEIRIDFPVIIEGGAHWVLMEGFLDV